MNPSLTLCGRQPVFVTRMCNDKCLYFKEPIRFRFAQSRRYFGASQQAPNRVAKQSDLHQNQVTHNDVKQTIYIRIIISTNVEHNKEIRNNQVKLPVCGRLAFLDASYEASLDNCSGNVSNLFYPGRPVLDNLYPVRPHVSCHV